MEKSVSHTIYPPNRPGLLGWLGQFNKPLRAYHERTPLTGTNLPTGSYDPADEYPTEEEFETERERREELMERNANL